MPSSSIGFCVASTKNGAGSRYKWPRTVQECSCMASSRADCVFGGVRLISSARIILPKIGPSTKVHLRCPVSKSSSIMSVPVMSDGIRSGVNWMRRKARPIASAMVRTIRVLAVPGMPVKRQWPPTKRAIRIWSSTSSWPTMTERTCSRTRSRTAWKCLTRCSRSAASSSNRAKETIEVLSHYLGVVGNCCN